MKDSQGIIEAFSFHSWAKDVTEESSLREKEDKRIGFAPSFFFLN